MLHGVGADGEASADKADRADADASPDATRTSSGAGNEPATPASTEARDRLPAPLQRRDRERYRIIGEHGRGGLGRVFRAHDEDLGRDIAIKELLDRGATSELRFFREALITARLEHPGIVPVHEAGRWPDGTPFYAMKLVAGRPFKEVIDDAKTMEERLALLPHVVAIADAIAYAHDRRIIHRDLKPANVIIGDFGETVVIDWGLAKDLTDAAEDNVEAGPYRTPASGGLTAAGSILGTPAYMAPEQLKGIADERSDIFALGGILFHVLTGASPRPDIVNNGPRDVRAICERAMALDPQQRYATVRAFADDLRHYLQHRPVSARNYSLAGRAVLGFARHRTVALATMAAMFVTIGILVGAIVKIERQRGRERSALHAADVARQNSEEARANLELKHAELLLTVDPTAATDLLLQYRGHDEVARARLLAKARGMGVAERVSVSHTDEALLLESLDDGHVLFVGGDGAITLSTASAELTVARDAALIPVFAYSGATLRLAYPRNPVGIALADLTTRKTRVIDDDFTPRAMAMTLDGRLLAASTADGELHVWNIVDESHNEILRTQIDNVKEIAFVDENTLIARADESLSRLELGTGTSKTIPVPRGHRLIATPRWLAVDSPEGGLEVRTTDDLIRAGSAQVCVSRLNSLRASADGRLLVIGCQTGSMAVWDALTLREIERVDVGTALASVTLSADNRYLAGGGDSAVLYIYDRESGVTSEYRGHPAAISAIATPHGNQPHFASGDVNGVLRLWPSPSASDRILFRGDTTIFHAVFSPDASIVLTDGYDGKARKIAVADRTVRTLTVGNGPLYAIRFSPNGQRFVTWSDTTPVRVWRTSDFALLREFTGHRGVVADVEYFDDSTLASVGADGRVLLWSTDTRDVVTLLQGEAQLFALEPITARDAMVVADVVGNLTLIPREGTPRALPAPNTAGSTTMLKASPDGQLVAVGTSNGVVSLVDIAANASQIILRAGGPIRYIVLAAGGSVAVASEDGTVHLAVAQTTYSEWLTYPTQARYIALSPQGDRVAVTSTDGGVWIHGFGRSPWSYTTVHDASVLSANFSRDGRYLVTCDGAGDVAIHDFDLDIVHSSRPRKAENK